MTLLLYHANHLSADEIHSALRRRKYKIGTATVYQNLHLLTDAGLIMRFKGAENSILYDSNLTLHHHLVCKYCGKVEDISFDEWEKPFPRWNDLRSANAGEGWKIDRTRIEFRGICPSCCMKEARIS